MSEVKQAELFGSVLLQARKSRGFTQDQVIVRCGDILSKTYLSQLENGRRRSDNIPIRPGVTIVDALAEALGASKNEFRRLTGHPPLQDESTRDEIADEFTDMLARYKQLSGRSRIYIKNHVRDAIDFVLEFENNPSAAGKEPDDIAAAHNTVNFSPGPKLPEISFEKAMDVARKSRSKKIDKK